MLLAHYSPKLNQELNQAEFMTVITAVQKGDQIAIACDTQSTGGNTKHSAEYNINRSKILNYGDTFWGFAGATSIHQIFEDLFAESEPSPLLSRHDIFRWLLAQQDHLKEHYYIKTDISHDRQQAVEASQGNALVATSYGIYSINHYRFVQEYSKFWALGSGADIALGAMEVLYPQKLTASEIAEAGAFTATKFNIHCAPPIRVETLQKEKEPTPKASKAKKKAPAQKSTTRKTTTRKTSKATTRKKKT